MTDSIDPLLAYHRAFCEASGTLDPNDLRYHKHWSRFYYELHHEGFSVEEMVLVVKFVMAQNKKQKDFQFRRPIVPSKIIGDIGRFCEDLARAKQQQALRTSPRQQAIDSFRGYRQPEDVKITAQPVRDILRKAIAP